MPGLISEDLAIPKERLHTSICLIMIIEYKSLDLEELIKMTGLGFEDTRSAMQNLSRLQLISILPGHKSFPKFELINEDEATRFLELMGI
jgi:hypothetical protein